MAATGGGGGGGGGEGEEQYQQETNKRKLDTFELAKQKAQEIAARIYNSAESKRSRFDDSTDDLPPFTTEPTPQMTQVVSTPYPVQQQSYGFQGSSKKIDIPNAKVGVIIGKGGETIKYLQLQSGARIHITKDSDADPYSQTRDVEITGTAEQITRAEQLVNDVISETDAGGSGSAAVRGSSFGAHGGDQFAMKVPNDKVAWVIGKGGETIKNIQSRSGARIQNRLNPQTTSNYTQQGYGPPGNWSQPPMQQPAHGYAQPGAYPTGPPSYYSNYPQQPAAPTWDQSNPSSAHLPPQQNAGYNYYGQQAPTETGSAQANASYAYGQAPPSTNNYDQSYSQQPHSYGQDTAAQAPQHDQQKQYTSPGYGPPAASSQLDGTVLGQSYGTQSSTQPPSAYPVDYNQPQNVSSAGYGPSQGYTAPLANHPGYDQTGYNQSGYGGQKPPQYLPPVQNPVPTSQPVYGQGGYPSQPAPAQPTYVQGTNPPGYGQQQPHTQSTTYTEKTYGSERNGDGNNAQSGYASSPAVQEGVHPQS
ncbi:hypothetical protein IFM89_036772 [Coptis chinensis]|uniref:K Homology domain-containing protein n=1 Tax=Coptis chinensis TaxID=261450 RepID=A0A835HRX7_9MAGN|nr:hypothetical protein IFM89_036772 [Coptis chinensis]